MKIKKILGISILSVLLLIPNVNAKEVTYNPGDRNLQSEGINNLQQFIDKKTESGDVIHLLGTTYTAVPVTIDKDLTIEGVGNVGWDIEDTKITSTPKTIFNGKITITGNAKNVTIKNIYLGSGAESQSNITFVSVKTKTHLIIDNIYNMYISRDFTLQNVSSINLDEGSEGSTLDMKNSYLYVPYDALRVATGNNHINLNNTCIKSQIGIALAPSGDEIISDNVVNISNNSYLQGHASYKETPIKSEEVIAIKNQENLTLNITDSTLSDVEDVIYVNMPSHLIDFEGSKNKNVTINIKGNSKLMDNGDTDSYLFRFGDDLKDNKNVIKISKDTTIEEKTASHKYNINGDRVVVGIHDYEGNAKIKVYDKNDVIPSLELENAIPKNYRLIGWFTNKKLETEFVTTTPLTTNLDIYPKTIEQITIKINEEEFTIDKGSNLNSLSPEDAERLENTLKAEGKDFKNFAIKNDENTYTKESNFDESVTLIPKYTVTITIGEEEFTLDEGANLKSLKGEDKARLDKITKVTTKNFKDFKDGSNLDTKFSKHTTLTPHYTVTVTIGDKEFEIDENTKLTDIKNNKDLDNILSPTNKTFKEFVDLDDNTYQKDYTFTENKELKATYTVTVTVDGHEFTLNEGESLNNLPSEKLTELNNLLKKDKKTFKNFTNNNKEYTMESKFNENITLTSNYTVKVTIGTETFILDENNSLESLKDEAKTKLDAIIKLADKDFKEFKDGSNLKTKFTEDTTLVPTYTVTITIGEEEFTLDEETSLNSLTSEDKERLDKITETTTKNFKGFIDGSNLETTFSKHTTLTPHYTITVTIDGKDFELEENTKLTDIHDNEDLNNILNPTNKIFKEFVDLDDNTYQKDAIFKENIELISKYTITVTIGEEEFILDENSNLESLTGEDKVRLEAITKRSDKNFNGFKENVRLDSNLTQNTTLTPTYTVTVKIGEEEFTINEGETLSGDALEALEALKTLHEDLTFKRFETIDKEEFDVNEPITKNTEVIAVFKITVTIGDKEFELETGETLNDLDEEGKKALEELKNNHEKGQKFSKFIDSSSEDEDVIYEDTILNNNVTLKAIYEADVPKTLDNIVTYVIIGIISLITIVTSSIVIKKKLVK